MSFRLRSAPLCRQHAALSSSKKNSIKRDDNCRASDIDEATPPQERGIGTSASRICSSRMSETELKDQSFDIAWGVLLRSGDLGDPDASPKFLFREIVSRIGKEDRVGWFFQTPPSTPIERIRSPYSRRLIHSEIIVSAIRQPHKAPYSYGRLTDELMQRAPASTNPKKIRRRVRNTLSRRRCSILGPLIPRA